jgi:hypothetical protein
VSDELKDMYLDVKDVIKSIDCEEGGRKILKSVEDAFEDKNDQNELKNTFDTKVKDFKKIKEKV